MKNLSNLENHNSHRRENQINSDFKDLLVSEIDKFNQKQEKRFPQNERLVIDLHCHDHNSDVPDELMGRLLEIPETWLPSEDLLAHLERNGCNAYTITNHNNARSCYEQADKGVDILTAAEFTCMVPDFNTWIHVLAYGFGPEEEVKLNKYRYDLYRFLRYTREENIPVIWAHPLYYYSEKGIPPLEFFEKLSVIFGTFEIINGQRNTRQNLLMKKWIETLNRDKLDAFAKKHKIKPLEFTENPYKKRMSGGSDCHMGIFAGLTGTYLHVPNLEEKLKNTAKSQLVLEALSNGEMAPFGMHNESERLMVAFLDYFCQIAIHMKDPGLIRILLHKGSAQEKLHSLVVGNAFMEMKRHKVTMSFLKTFHHCFKGIDPGISRKLLIKPVYRNIFTIARSIAITRRETPGQLTPAYLNKALLDINEKLNHIFYSRLKKKINKMDKPATNEQDFEKIVRSLELPIEFQKYLGNQKKKGKINLGSNMTFEKFLDGLSFPLLGAAVLYAAKFASTTVLFNSRPLLNAMAKRVKAFEQPGRALWLTDTFSDKNGVAHSLRVMHAEIKKRNLPIDILVCSNNIEPDDHLIVVPAMYEFTLPMYEHQPFRIPDFLQVHQIFDSGSYDRLICSTEGPIGLFSLILKRAFSVPAYFYLHTDWLTFSKKNLSSDVHMVNRIRRILRVLYRQFDYLFVLNGDQRKWLSGKEMGIDETRIFTTAHWVDPVFKPKKDSRKQLFKASEKDKILLFVGRVSKEKGIMDLAFIYDNVKKSTDNVKLVVVGSGPAEKEIKEAIPDLIHIPWMDHDKLPDIYSSADLLVLPSNFDTFGLVVLEALSCGLPVAAYNIMGPGEIIENEKSGYLAKNKRALSEKITQYLQTPAKWKRMKKNAWERSKKYQKKNIMDLMIKNLSLIARR